LFQQPADPCFSSRLPSIGYGWPVQMQVGKVALFWQITYQKIFEVVQPFSTGSDVDFGIVALISIRKTSSFVQNSRQ
jgi:hypothetical protein